MGRAGLQRLDCPDGIEAPRNWLERCCRLVDGVSDPRAPRLSSPRCSGHGNSRIVFALAGGGAVHVSRSPRNDPRARSMQLVTSHLAVDCPESRWTACESALSSILCTRVVDLSVLSGKAATSRRRVALRPCSPMSALLQLAQVSASCASLQSPERDGRGGGDDADPKAKAAEDKLLHEAFQVGTTSACSSSLELALLNHCQTSIQLIFTRDPPLWRLCESLAIEKHHGRNTTGVWSGFCI